MAFFGLLHFPKLISRENDEFFTLWCGNFRILVTQFLREIKFGVSRSSKNAVLAILRAVKIVDLVNSAFKKCKNPSKSKFRASECVKMANFALQEFQKFISRKI